MWCGCSCSLCSCFPVPSPGPKARFDRLTNRLEAGRATAYGSSEEFARSIDEISTHPMLEALKEVGDTAGREMVKAWLRGPELAA